MSLADAPIHFDDRGLIPAVLQDSTTGQVLMVAWMNEVALRLTRKTGEAHFWSRSRQELWHKGATSGNFMVVEELWVDCDGDTLLLQVNPQGPACHTGQVSCFFRRMDLPAAAPAPDRPEPEGDDALHALFDTILNRQANPRPGSYTARLLGAGEDEILKKVGEEAMEVILAAKGQGDERLVAEVADLLYHLLVLLASRGLTLDGVESELVGRRR